MDYEKEWTDSSRTLMGLTLVLEIVFTLIDMIARAVTEKGVEVHEVRASAQKYSVISNPILMNQNRRQIVRSGIGFIGCDFMALLCVQFPFPIPMLLLSLYMTSVHFYFDKNLFHSWFEVRAEKINGMEHLVLKYPIEWRLRWLSYGFSLLVFCMVWFAIISYYTMVWIQFLVWTGIPLLPFGLSVGVSIYLCHSLGKWDWDSQQQIQNEPRMMQMEQQEQRGWD